MKKIPTLFEKIYEDNKFVGITNKVTDGMEWVLNGEGFATLKLDGSCCAIIDGVFYKRYDAKNGKTPPKNAFPCCGPDPITGHWPHWVPVDFNSPSDKWFVEAYNRTTMKEDWTYEAIGRHFQGNPYKMDYDVLIPHGMQFIEVGRSFNEIKTFLKNNRIEGIVFWKDGEPQCKIKRSDFGYDWP